MTVKVAINGFGRIGRLVLRTMVQSGRTDVEPVAINDLGSVEANAHLFRYDSVHGRFPGEVIVDGNTITINLNGRTWGPIRVSAERDPRKVPYGGVDVAMECTGLFTSKQSASALIEAGARKVLVSAPADGVDATIVYGVNHQVLTPEMTVVSNASCTTNCLAPMAKVLHAAFGIERGYMVTIHSYTGDQKTVDTLHKDLHRARAAALSMIPTSTGAAKALGLVIPELAGKLDGTSVRVPTPNVSLVSLDANLAKPATSRQPLRANSTVSSATTTKNSSAPTSTAYPNPAPSTPPKRPRSTAARSSASRAGMITNGAFRPACPTPRRCSEAFKN
jgi:glyceraldehyde 3-phosphate dehydrogenase